MPNIYNLPVKVFHQVIETNNMGLLLHRKVKGKYAKMIRRIPGLGLLIWEKLTAQLIKEFGVSQEFEAMFYKQRDINNLEIQAMLGDTSAEFLISTYKSDLERIKQRLSRVDDFRKYHAKLHRAITARYTRDSHSLTVFEFYNDLNDLQKEAEEKEMEVIRNGTNG